MEETRSRHADAPPRCRSGGISLGMKGPERARDVLAVSWAATVSGESQSGAGVSFGQIGRFALDLCFFALAKNYSSEIPVRPQLRRAVRSPLPPPPACAAVGEPPPTFCGLLQPLVTIRRDRSVRHSRFPQPQGQLRSATGPAPGRSGAIWICVREGTVPLAM